MERDEKLLLQGSDREMDSFRSIDHDSNSDTKAPRSMNVTTKLGLVLFLFIVAGVLGYVGYYFAATSQENAYQSAFMTDAQYLIKNFHDNSLRIELEALSYAFQITASMKSAAYSWPFVTMAMEFEVVCFNMLRQSLATTAFFAPILTEDERRPWESFAAQTQPEIQNIASTHRSISDGIYRMKDGLPENETDSAAFYSPIWHVAPRLDEQKYIMFNQASHVIQRTALGAMFTQKSMVSSDIFLSDAGAPQFVRFFPIFETLERERVVGSLSLLTDLTVMFEMMLSTNNTSIDVVLDSNCGKLYTFRIHAENSSAVPTAMLLGEGDLHDPAFDAFEATFTNDDWVNMWNDVVSTAPKEVSTFYKERAPSQNIFGESASLSCGFDVRLYPTEEYETVFVTTYPLGVALGISLSLVVAASLFLTYAFVMERRQRDARLQTKREDEANGALVRSFFPKIVRDRVVLSTSMQDRNHGDAKRGMTVASINESLDRPIAEQFPNTTVMFADLVGFTAWSSDRQPEEVFLLLETLYERFDAIAKEFDIFKVETIGDCYMAVAGLPKPNQHHALSAARFAYECLVATTDIMADLEVRLGPGTTSLGLRVGLHSGTVTGGVLRGEKARFQLFGDTVNTASRMETNGVSGRVQVSQATADLIIASGKQHWLTPRKEMIQAKGKGKMQVYFFKPRSNGLSKLESMSNWHGDKNVDMTVSTATMGDEASECDGNSASSVPSSSPTSRINRLIDWNTNLLVTCLLNRQCTRDRISASKYGQDFRKYQTELHKQMRAFIEHLSTLFPDLPYHNFEHASVSAMFANTLMKLLLEKMERDRGAHCPQDPSVPIAHFITVFSALLHDMRYTKDHNGCLVTLIMKLLSSPQYEAIYFALCQSFVDERAFTSMFFICVHAFPAYNASCSSRPTRNGTICWEANCCNLHKGDFQLPGGMMDTMKLVIMSSEIAHWLQHWNTFFVWHGMYFAEIYGQFLKGIGTHDPSLIWHQNELRFFNDMVQPVAAELEACGFGEFYSSRAEENYREWQLSGHQQTLESAQAEITRQTGNGKTS